MFEYLDKLNEEQKEAAMHIDGPLLIIAGAGSGKTTTLINRVAYMVDRGIDAESILLLTFTNAAADNMKKRASNLSNPNCKNITASTYHSFCAEIVRKYASFVGVKKDFVILTPSEELEAFKLCKSELGYGKFKDFPQSKDVMDVVSTCLNKMEDVYSVLDDVLEEKGEIIKDAVKKVVKRLIEYKKENNLMSYDDLLVKMEELLRNEDIRDLLEERYQYVMVDEYQDTNKIQEKIVFALTKEKKNLVVVGDDYQSIYAFRCADINNIIDFPKKIGSCKQIVIDKNYRSSKEILDIANEIMDSYANFGYPKIMKDNGKTSEKVTFVKPGKCDEEADLIFESIKKWRDSGKNLSEYAVLARKSKSSSLLEVKLAKEGIEYEKLGGLKFLEHECIVDMLAIFKAISNPSDELSWFHLLDILPGIGEVYAHKVMNDLKDGTLDREDSPWKKKKFYEDLVSLRAFVEEMRSNNDLEYVFDNSTSYYINIRNIKIENMVVKNEEYREQAREQLKDDVETIGILKDIAMGYDNLVEFLDSIVLDANVEIPTEGKVIISTIHSAKGLEWEHVDLMDCMDDIFPIKSGTEFEQMEDLRCLYVALTRAKDEEVVYAPNFAMICGKDYHKVSPFLATCFEKKLFKLDANTNVHLRNGGKKVYLNVSFHEKETAKSYGAKWDSLLRCWFIPEDHKNAPILIRMFGQAIIR